MNNVGFFLPILESEKHQVILEHISKLVKQNRDKQIVVFSCSPKIVVPSDVPVLSLKESKYFKGKLFIFDLLSALLVKSFATQEQYFWIGEAIFWENQPQEMFSVFNDIFKQNNMNLIVQNQRVSDIYEICYYKPKYIVEEFNYEKLQRLI